MCCPGSHSDCVLVDHRNASILSCLSWILIITLNPGGQSCTDVTSSSCLIQVSVEAERVKLVSMRSC